MAWQPELYPERWTEMRREALDRVRNARGIPECELCHVEQGTRRRNTHTDKPYFVYLSVCHRLFYHTWKQETDTIVLCQRCHNRFDARFRKRIKWKQETPIGKANVYVQEDDRLVLAAMCKTYIELLAFIDALQVGQEFEIHLEINLSIVGNGYYRRTRTGCEVIREYAACEDLGLSFLVIPERMKPAPPLLVRATVETAS